MSEFNITVEGGSSVRLPTAGKYVDRDIIVTATGSTETPENLDDVLTKQEQLIDQLTIALDNKASGGGETLGADIYIIYGGQLFTLWEFAKVAFPDFGVIEETSVVMVTDDPPTYKRLPWRTLFIVSPTSGKSQVIWAEEGFVGYVTLQDLSGLPDHGWIEKETLEALDKTSDSNMGIYAVKTASYPLVDGTLREFESRTQKVRDNAFSYFIALESASLPNATFIGMSAFEECCALKNIYVPKVKKILGTTFYGCYSLTDIELPEAQEIGSYSFIECGSLVNVYLPKARSIYYSAFFACETLPKIDLPKVNLIGDFAFESCSSLHTVILRNDTPVTLTHPNVFRSTPIENGDGYIYVPKSLVETYKTETNWTLYANQIRAIEDYPEICGG